MNEKYQYTDHIEESSGNIELDHIQVPPSLKNLNDVQFEAMRT